MTQHNRRLTQQELVRLITAFEKVASYFCNDPNVTGFLPGSYKVVGQCSEPDSFYTELDQATPALIGIFLRLTPEAYATWLEPATPGRVHKELAVQLTDLFFGFNNVFPKQLHTTASSLLSLSAIFNAGIWSGPEALAEFGIREEGDYWVTAPLTGDISTLANAFSPAPAQVYVTILPPEGEQPLDHEQLQRYMQLAAGNIGPAGPWRYQDVKRLIEMYQSA